MKYVCTVETFTCFVSLGETFHQIFHIKKKEQLQKHYQIISIDKYHFSWTIAFYDEIDIIKRMEVDSLKDVNICSNKMTKHQERLVIVTEHVLSLIWSNHIQVDLIRTLHRHIRLIPYWCSYLEFEIYFLVGAIKTIPFCSAKQFRV